MHCHDFCLQHWDCSAGVYFEKYVKGKLGQTLWIRNLQLSIYGVPLSIVYTILKDGGSVPICMLFSMCPAHMLHPA